MTSRPGVQQHIGLQRGIRYCVETHLFPTKQVTSALGNPSRTLGYTTRSPWTNWQWRSHSNKENAPGVKQEADNMLKPHWWSGQCPLAKLRKQANNDQAPLQPRDDTCSTGSHCPCQQELLSWQWTENIYRTAPSAPWRDRGTRMLVK